MSRGGRILIVDDEPLLVKAARRLLELQGYEAHGAQGGAAALELIEQHRFHLVLCDVRMPDVDGPAVLQALRSRGHRTPLVFLTGYGDHSDAELRALGAVGVYGKPLVAQKLFDVIEMHIERDGG